MNLWRFSFKVLKKLCCLEKYYKKNWYWKMIRYQFNAKIEYIDKYAQSRNNANIKVSKYVRYRICLHFVTEFCIILRLLQHDKQMLLYSFIARWRTTLCSTTWLTSTPWRPSCCAGASRRPWPSPADRPACRPVSSTPCPTRHEVYTVKS